MAVDRQEGPGDHPMAAVVDRHSAEDRQEEEEEDQSAEDTHCQAVEEENWGETHQRSLTGTVPKRKPLKLNSTSTGSQTMTRIK